MNLVLFLFIFVVYIVFDIKLVAHISVYYFKISQSTIKKLFKEFRSILYMETQIISEQENGKNFQIYMATAQDKISQLRKQKKEIMKQMKVYQDEIQVKTSDWISKNKQYWTQARIDNKLWFQKSQVKKFQSQVDKIKNQIDDLKEELELQIQQEIENEIVTQRQEAKKSVELSSQQQMALKFTKIAKVKYQNSETWIRMVGKDRKTNEPLYYTMPLDWLLKDGQWNDQHAYDLMKMFLTDPVNFKGQINKQQRQLTVKQYDMLNDFNSDKKNKNDNGSDAFYDGEFYDVEGDWGDIDIQDIDLDDVQLDIQVFGGLKDISQFRQVNKIISENNCFYNCLFHYGINDESAKQIHKIDDIVSYLEKLGKNYRIFHDDLSFITIDYVKDQQNVEEPMKFGNNTYRQIKQKMNVYKQHKFGQGQSTGEVLLFAIKIQQQENHIFVPQQKNIFVNQTRTSIFEYLDNKMERMTKIQQSDSQRLIFYDLETIEEYANNMKFKCVSCSITYVDLIGGQQLQDFSEEQLIQELQKNCRFFIDENIDLKKIFDKILHKDYDNCILSFNGAKFDNILLLKSFIKNKIASDVSVQNGMIELKNTSTQTQYRYHTIDLRRFLGPGSLAYHSENYIKNQLFAKKKQNHLFKILQSQYDKGQLLDREYKYQIEEQQRNFLDDLERYNNIDVISLALIQRRLLENLDVIFKTNSHIFEKDCLDEFYKSVSTPHFFYKLFQKSLSKIQGKPKKFKELNKKQTQQRMIEQEQQKIKAISLEQEPKMQLSEEEIKKKRLLQYQIYQQFKTGGRCDCNKKMILGKKIYSLDVCSLYPFVMLCYHQSYYMSGEMIETDRYQEGKLGIYFGTIKQTRLNNEMLYYAKKDIVNDFNCEEEIQTVFTSHEIEYFRQLKPHWQIKIEFGFYTQDKIKGCDLFKVLIPFAQEKCKQDKYKQDKNTEYNQSMRELCKTMMNSLSGKFLQAQKETEYYLSQDLKLMSRKIEESEFLQKSVKSDKMLHIGLFIYSLSKLYMYKYQYGQYSRDLFIYTDTDSNKMDEDMFQLWNTDFGNKILMEDIIFPECFNMNLGYERGIKMFYKPVKKWFLGNRLATEQEIIQEQVMKQGKLQKKTVNLKCLGQFEDEYEDDNFRNAIFADKKEYIVWNDEHQKCLLKGIDQNNFYLLNIYNQQDLSIKGLQVKVVNKYTGKKSDIQKYVLLNPIEQQKYRLSIQFDQDLLVSSTAESTFKNREMIEDLTHNNPLKKQQIKQIIYNKFNGVKNYVLTSNFKKDIKSLEIYKSYIVKEI